MTIKIKKYKIGRRLGAGVYDKCQSQKFVLSQARKLKSERRGRRRKRPTDYGLSLIEKQKVRFSYGIREKQFRNYIKKALNSVKKKLNPASVLYSLLENRIDNVIYRLGIAPTRRAARQLVSHGHILINGKKTNVPSHSVKINDKIEIREGSKEKKVFADLKKIIKSHKSPDWIRFDDTKLVAEIFGEAKNPDPFLDFQAVIEFYNK